MDRLKDIWTRPGFLIRRLHQIQVAAFLAECSDVDVTPVQWGVLSVVARKPGVGHIEISEDLGLDRSNVANVVARLAKRGLLKQRSSLTDRRKKNIVLTAAAQKLIEHVSGCAQRAQHKILNPLSDAERKLFVSLLSRLVWENDHLGRALLKMT